MFELFSDLKWNVNGWKEFDKVCHYTSILYSFLQIVRQTWIKTSFFSDFQQTLLHFICLLGGFFSIYRLVVIYVSLQTRLFVLHPNRKLSLNIVQYK